MARARVWQDISLEPMAMKEIKSLILTVREKQVLLDSDVARLYGYETKTINQAASRNKDRFPPEFRFRLTADETEDILRSQIVTSKYERGGRRYRPYVFTEQGIGMLSGLLKNKTAVQVSVSIIVDKLYVPLSILVNTRPLVNTILSVNTRPELTSCTSPCQQTPLSTRLSTRKTTALRIGSTVVSLKLLSHKNRRS